MKPFSALAALLFAATTFSQTTLTLQEGVDGYTGCTDRAVVDTYNFMKTSWWLSEEAIGGHTDLSSPKQPEFGVAYFEC